MQVHVIMDVVEGEDFKQLATKPLASMACGAPGQAFVAFEKPEGACSIGKFANTLRFYVKEVGRAQELLLGLILLTTLGPYHIYLFITVCKRILLFLLF